MRYVPVLAIMFVNSLTVTLPAQAGVFEIRSMSAMRNKPIFSLWERFAKKVVDADILLKVVVEASAVILPPLLGGVLIHPLNATIPIMFVNTPAVFLIMDAAHSQEDPVKQLKGKHIYFKQWDEGEEVLRFGLVEGTPYGKSEELIVLTTAGQSRIPIDAIVSVSLPDHPDLHRQVRLLASADYIDDLYHLGRVSKVYGNGHYLIMIDRKVDYDNIESHVDESITILVNASLPEAKGGLAFIDNMADEHEDIDKEYYVNDPFHDELIAAARQADFAQVKLEESFVHEK